MAKSGAKRRAREAAAAAGDSKYPEIRAFVAQINREKASGAEGPARPEVIRHPSHEDLGGDGRGDSWS